MSVIKMTDLDLAGKRLLIREDLNVPLSDGKVSSDKRIRASLPTIEHAMNAGARVMLMSHIGRPTEGEYDPDECGIFLFARGEDHARRRHPGTNDVRRDVFDNSIKVGIHLCLRTCRFELRAYDPSTHRSPPLLV